MRRSEEISTFEVQGRKLTAFLCLLKRTIYRSMISKYEFVTFEYNGNTVFAFQCSSEISGRIAEESSALESSMKIRDPRVNLERPSSQ